MSEREARDQLLAMLDGLRPGSILHILGEVIREHELKRVGDLDEVAEERMALAQGFLVVAGIGLDSVCYR